MNRREFIHAFLSLAAAGIVTTTPLRSYVFSESSGLLVPYTSSGVRSCADFNQDTGDNLSGYLYKVNLDGTIESIDPIQRMLVHQSKWRLPPSSYTFKWLRPE